MGQDTTTDMQAGQKDGPIFVVGMPRSGTTLFQRVVAVHPDLCTTTRETRDFPTSVTLSRMMRLLGKTDKPGEAGRIWDKFLCHDHDVMQAADVTGRARRFYRAMLVAHLELYGTSRFLARYPPNGLRMPYLKEIFPDAQFVHILRDGRAVCESLIRMRKRDVTLETWWGSRPPSWRELERLPPIESVAHQWVEVVRRIIDAGEALPAGCYTELRYEDLTGDPAAALKRFFDHCGLAHDAATMETLSTRAESQNFKWREVFSGDEISTVERITGPLLKELGYEIDA
jgi:hypothetical protein